MEEHEEEYVRVHEKYYTFYWDNRKKIQRDVKTARNCPLVLSFKVRLEASLGIGEGKIIGTGLFSGDNSKELDQLRYTR